MTITNGKLIEQLLADASDLELARLVKSICAEVRRRPMPVNPVAEGRDDYARDDYSRTGTELHVTFLSDTDAHSTAKVTDGRHIYGASFRSRDYLGLCLLYECCDREPSALVRSHMA